MGSLYQFKEAPNEPPTPERLLHEQEAAKLLGVSHYWLQRQRWFAHRTRFVRVGGKGGRG